MDLDLVPIVGDTILVDGAIEEVVSVDMMSMRVFTTHRSFHFEDVHEPQAPDPGDTEAVEKFLLADWAGTSSPVLDSEQVACACGCKACYAVKTTEDGKTLGIHHFRDTACRCLPKECLCI